MPFDKTMIIKIWLIKAAGKSKASGFHIGLSANSADATHENMNASKALNGSRNWARKIAAVVMP